MERDRQQLRSQLRDAILQVEQSKGKRVQRAKQHEFNISSTLVPLREFYSKGNEWNLTPLEKGIEENQTRVSVLLDAVQGVTWGGEGAENVYVLSESDAKLLERELVHRGLKGRDIKRGRIEWDKRYFLYPYTKDQTSNKWLPAFKIPTRDIDALDFNLSLDDTELSIKSQIQRTEERVKALYQHRCAIGLVKYPRAGKHLVDNYNTLSARKFEGRSLSDYNKMWYEYHRARKQSLLLKKPKIVASRMLKAAKFALDVEGFLPQDSTVALVPKPDMLKKLGYSNETETERALRYIISQLNTENTDRILRSQVSRKRGGYSRLSETTLRKITIPLPK